MVYVLSILHCRTNSEQISRPAAGRIDTALFIIADTGSLDTTYN